MASSSSTPYFPESPSPSSSGAFTLKVSAAEDRPPSETLLSEGEEEIVLDNVHPVDLLKDGQLSLASRGLTQVPAEIFAMPDLSAITALDLTSNRLESLDHLDLLPELTRLVLDSNDFSEHAFKELPFLPKLDTLWANSNRIADVDLFIEYVSAKCPKLLWLSLLKNPGCPNYFTGRDPEDYQRHRLFVIHRLPKLRFLDSNQVTPDERKEAARVGHLMKTARGQNQSPQKATVADDLEAQGLSPLPLTITRPGKGATTFGVSRYVYYGRQSEGNRFIRDDAL